MNEEYYYYEENGKLFRFHLERDEIPWNPRKDQDGNIGTMNLYWNRYELGDNDGKGDADDTLNEIIFDNVSEDKYDEENVIYDMGRNEKIVLLQSQENIVLLPCFIYEHSGLTISCSNASYPFNDRWDSGMAGYIYTTKAKCEEQWGTDEVKADWKLRAARELVYEVKLYDQYLQGECYGYRVDRYNPEDDEWEEDVESCWGYYSDKWGTDLAREIADNNITSESFISEEDAEITIANMRQIALEEKAERKVMEQADYMVCI